MYFLELEKHCPPPNLQRHWAIVLNVFEETIKYGSQKIYNPYLPCGPPQCIVHKTSVFLVASSSDLQSISADINNANPGEVAMHDPDMDADEENQMTDVEHDWQQDRQTLGMDNASIQASAGWLNRQKNTVEIRQDWSDQYNPAELNPEHIDNLKLKPKCPKKWVIAANGDPTNKPPWCSILTI